MKVHETKKQRLDQDCNRGGCKFPQLFEKIATPEDLFRDRGNHNDDNSPENDAPCRRNLRNLKTWILSDSKRIQEYGSDYYTNEESADHAEEPQPVQPGSGKPRCVEVRSPRRRSREYERDRSHEAVRNEDTRDTSAAEDH